ncbi:hypothetical protein [Streptomyces griseoluteus]|uniref:hypothetical protein n=1 Tax=Streptomyces griseoluteus TaxID=29306 RepID=UPI0036FB4DA2
MDVTTGVAGTKRVLVAAAVMVAALATAAVGCSTQQKGPDGARQGGEARALTRPDLPAHQPHPLSERQKDVLHDAEELLTRSCMAAHGFKTWVVPRRPLADDREFPYAVDDVRWASQHGYGGDMAARRERLRLSDPNRRYFAGLAPSRQKRALDAYHGAESTKRITVKAPNGLSISRADGGCVALSERKLYGDLATWFRVTTVTDALTGMRRQMVQKDAEFKSSVEDWAACMRKRGFSYASPEKARIAFADPHSGVPRKEEKPTAVAEARCAAATGLSRSVRRLDQRYGERLNDIYADAVRTRLRLENEALPHARAIVRSQ